MLGSKTSNPLALQRERQLCWQSPRIAISNVSDGVESPKNDAEARSKPTPNSRRPHETRTAPHNNQQISAGIINKIQNNYQVQVTNISGYDSAMTTASAHALHQIT